MRVLIYVILYLVTLFLTSWQISLIVFLTTICFGYELKMERKISNNLYNNKPIFFDKR